MKYIGKLNKLNQKIVQMNLTPGSNCFKLSERPFMFPRKVISDFYPDFPDHPQLDNTTFKVYLYLCMSCNGLTGNVNLSSKQKIAEILKVPPYSSYINWSLDWLETNHFIRDIRTKDKARFRAQIMSAPDYLPELNTFYSCKDVPRNPTSMKNHNYGYILVPASAITDKMLDQSLTRTGWDERKLKIFLLMYQYNWLRYYGGIDPDIMHITQNGELELDTRFCYDVKSTPYNTFQTVQSFINADLFKPVRCVFRKKDGEQFFVGDVGRVTPQKNDHEIIILRPQVLIAKQVEKLVELLGKGSVVI
ncbi:hypothetical protein [Brevibacillus agri]|uniref:hypothetical protein n=1 Tax=Brevibacillus agri TaxID=51101 RepID=UPI003D9AB31B